jgi:hypothetical protein
MCQEVTRSGTRAEVDKHKTELNVICPEGRCNVDGSFYRNREFFRLAF